MNKSRTIIILSTIITIVTGTTGCQSSVPHSVNLNRSSIEEVDKDKFKVDPKIFQQTKDNQTLVLKDKNDVFKMSEEKYYVYFTKTECPFCEMLEPIIEYYTVEFNQPKLYFVDGDQCKDLNIFIKEGNPNSSSVPGYTLSGVPSMLVIENGELKDSLVGIESINDELKKEALES